MKSYKLFYLSLLLVFNFNVFAQLKIPNGSQKAMISQRIGITDIAIKYSRPSVNGREIWGKLVPFGFNNLGFGTATEAPWRAGADENTTISFSHDVKVEGKLLKAGIYGLHMALYENGKATIIFSKDFNSWGSFFYNSKNDALRVEVATKHTSFRELLTYEFNVVTPISAIVSLVWEKKEIPFEIEINVSETVLNDFRENGAKGQEGFNRQNWETMANYALNNNGDLNEALSWINGAIQGNFYSQKTFNNLAIKARILKKLGKEDEYSLLMDEAASLANTNQLNALGYQMLNFKDYERAIKFFKKNVENNPKNANVYDSLGEAYKTIGDKKNAVKYLKKALTLNPPANVRANSEKLLNELNAM